MRPVTALLLAATLAPAAAAQFHVRSPNQARPGFPIYSPYYNPGPVYGSSPVALGSSIYSGSSYPMASYGRSYTVPYSGGVSYSQPMTTYPQSYTVMPGTTITPPRPVAPARRPRRQQ